MIEIRYVQAEDKEFWYSLDGHLPESEFDDKVRNKRGYILLEDNRPIFKRNSRVICWLKGKVA